MKQFISDNDARDKQQFIADYIHKRMKSNKLPYSIQYLNKLAKVEEQAEKAYKRKQSKL